MYVRFVVGEVDPDSNRETGVFQAAGDLRRSGRLSDYEQPLLCEIQDWFDVHLERPTRFTAAKPPYYRKQARAISWFKDTATGHIAKIREMVAILENHGIGVRMIKTDRP
ncbi:MAG TPA: hypothetical protein VGH38_00975, partial [Bryobacteraceae bacterium]